MPFFLVLLSFIALLSTSGCAPVVILGGAAGAGATLSKNKTIGSSLDDTNIWTKIKAGFLSHHKEIEGVMSTVSVEVSEGRVLLTGHVHSAENRLKVLQIVWEQAGVREVINELKIEDGDDISSYGSDLLITTKVKARLLGNKQIRSINYSVETINSIVYIIGVASTEEELSLVIETAEGIKNVEKVVNYIKVAKPHEVSEKESEAKDVKAEENTDKKEEMSEPKAQSNSKKKVDYTDISEDGENVIEIGQEDE